MVTAGPVRRWAAQAGDAEAFSELVEPYRAELLAHCYRLLAPSRTPKTWCRRPAWAGRAGGLAGPYFRAWLYKIATICAWTPWMRGAGADLNKRRDLPAVGVAKAIRRHRR